MIPRASAYMAAMMKTAGRAFAFDGTPVLTDDERALLERMEALDREDVSRNPPKTNASG